MSTTTTPTARGHRSPRPAREGARLLTVAQAALDLGIPATSIRDLISRGLLPVVRFEGARRIWIRRADLDALIQKSIEVMQ
ncbi:MAG: helix-turn-helix domain-containing protein [Acidobacteria bacterium]|nr:helix-turn-helix domain-containing protein [Acidobacteriota bacterium]